jgi:DNA-directed RNA polymerase specialized sigma subunit
MQYVDALTSELIMLAQAGDDKALAAVLAVCDPPLRAMAGRVQKSRDWEEMLVQYGRMGVVKALRTYQAERVAFWTFAHKHVKGSMIDGYAAELGLSSDARKAYPKVIGTYRQIAALHTRPPTASEVASACGVTKGLVDQIINVLYRPWLALDDIAEHAPGAIPPPAAPPSAYNSSPDTVVAAQDELDQRRALVQTLCAHCLGAEEAARFLVLQILREGSGGYDCGWDEIAAALCGTACPPSPDWEYTVAAEFAAWTCLPPTWPAVRELFLRQHPAPTSVYLRQRFSQGRRVLDRDSRRWRSADEE